MAKVKQIVGYENYSITENGSVISHRGSKDKILKPQIASQSKKGYLQVRLFNKDYPKGKLQYIHRLLYLSFIGEIPKGYEIDHIDGNPRNNNIFNLQIITRRENIHKHYRTNNGLILRDHRNEIIQDYINLGTLKKVGEKWGVSYQVIGRVVTNRTHYRLGKNKYKAKKYDKEINDEYSLD